MQSASRFVKVFWFVCKHHHHEYGEAQLILFCTGLLTVCFTWFVVCCDFGVLFAQVCDHKCTHKELDTKHGIYVCPISGHVFDGEVNHVQEEEEQEMAVGHSKLLGGPTHQQGGGKTWLARAYEAGYFAENIEELISTF